MILVDTPVWINHLRKGDPRLSALLQADGVRGHPWVTGEIALGRLGNRDEILSLLAELPQATVATDAELLTLIEDEHLQSAGIGYVDIQLIASARLTGDQLWSIDKRLARCAQRLGVGR